jgi:uncharacterized DUF497 family protein
MQFDGFDWDDGNWPKCGKHGVSKVEIEHTFSRLDLLVFRDEAHSGGEDRYLTIARGVGAHHGLLVGFTWRNRDGLHLIRPVTARYMHDKELKFHGK